MSLSRLERLERKVIDFRSGYRAAKNYINHTLEARKLGLALYDPSQTEDIAFKKRMLEVADRVQFYFDCGTSLHLAGMFLGVALNPLNFYRGPIHYRNKEEALNKKVKVSPLVGGLE